VSFCPDATKGKSANTKIFAIFLYISALSLLRIAKAVNADVHAVYRRILEYGRANYEKPQPQGEAAVVELDEMWHFLNAKKQNLDMESLLSRTPSAYRPGMWRAR
jgi:hypothetical protein